MKKLAALLTAAVVFACSFASSVFAEPSSDPGTDATRFQRSEYFALFPGLGL